MGAVCMQDVCVHAVRARIFFVHVVCVWVLCQRLICAACFVCVVVCAYFLCDLLAVCALCSADGHVHEFHCLPTSQQ